MTGVILKRLIERRNCGLLPVICPDYKQNPVNLSSVWHGITIGENSVIPSGLQTVGRYIGSLAPGALTRHPDRLHPHVFIGAPLKYTTHSNARILQ